MYPLFQVGPPEADPEMRLRVKVTYWAVFPG